MSFLDKPISELTSAELQRLIAHEVSRQVPPLPAGVAGLNDLEKPVTVTSLGTQGQVPTFHAPGTNFVFTSPGSLSDGVAPTLSPDLTAATSFVVGGIGLINATWLPVTNGDPVAYDVHISSVGASFTPTALTLFGTTESTSISIKTQANGSSLLYNIPYYIRIVAFDNDGAAAAGASVVAGTKISADIGTITAGTFIGTTFETSDPAGPAAQRVIIDPAGVHLTDVSGGVVVDLPTDILATAQFNGAVSAASLTSLASTLNGTTQLAGAMGLTSGVSQPLNPPGLAGAVLGGSLNPLTRYYVAFSWYDGTHETLISPVTSILPGGTNNTINVTLPPCPVGATSAIIYINAGSTFGLGTGHRQGTQSASTTASSTSPWTSYNNAGSAALTSATGPFSSTAATIRPNTADNLLNPYGYTLEGNGRIRFLGPTINSQFWQYWEFLNPGSALPDSLTEVTAAGGGAGNGWLTGTSTNVNPGVIRVNTGTGTTANDVVRTSNTVLALGAARIRFSIYMCVSSTGGTGALPAAGNQFQVIAGLSSVSTALSLGSSGDQVAFGFSTAATGGTNAKFGLWTGKAGVGAYNQAKDAAGADFSATLNGYILYEFEVNPAATSIDWWVNSVKQTAVTTAANIPASGSLMGAIFGITRLGSGAVNRELSVDTMAVYGDYVS